MKCRVIEVSMKSELEMLTMVAHEEVKMSEKPEQDLSEAELFYYELMRAIEEEDEVRKYI